MRTPHLPHLRAETARLLVLTLLAGVGALLVTAAGPTLSPAHAAPVTVTDPASGASITLSSAQIAPGERIQISGTGFVAAQGSSGETLVAVRPYDYDAGAPWTIGGDDAYFPGNPHLPPASEASHWFITDHTDNGSFSGWIQAPTTLPQAGPFDTGTHWLRILSGAFFSTTGDRLTVPTTFTVPFTVVDRLSTGVTSPNNIFQAGDHFRPGSQVTLRGRTFTPDSAVTVRLDETELTTSITTDADGVLPAGARVALPAGTTLGAHSLHVSTGQVSATVPITVTAPPTAVVPTTKVRPGGTVAYDLTGYLGVAGQPQKVAIVLSEQVLACVQVDAAGAARGTVTLPQSITASALLRFNVGLSCIMPPSGVINDQPVSSLSHTLTVSETAPQLTVDGDTYAGGTLAVSGSGFAASASIELTVGDGAPSTVVTDGSGVLNAHLAAPTTSGPSRVLADDGTDVTAAAVQVLPRRVSELTLTSPATGSWGGARSAAVALKVAGEPAAGSVVVVQGTWTKTLAIQATGTVTVALPRDLSPGSRPVTVRYAGTASTAPSEATRAMTIKKATPVVGLTVKKKVVARSKRAQATVTVRAAAAPSSLAVTGKFRVLVDGKVVATRQLATKHGGRISFALPRVRKPGKHTVRISWVGSTTVAAGWSKTVRFKVS